MADTLTPNIGFTNQTEGGNDNTWGVKTDDNWELADNKFGDVTSISTTGGTTVLTDEQEIVNAVKVSGTLVSNATVEFSGRGGTWIIQNATSGSFSVTVKVTGQTGFTVAQGTSTVVWCNGTDLVEAVPTAELVSDTSPQAGGDIDMNGHNIGFDDATGITDDSGNEQIRFQKTASAVNQIDITNAATGGSPSIAATGGDTNIDLTLAGQGTGGVVANFKQGTGLGLFDSDSSHALRLKTSSNLTANRTLDVVTGDADRALTIQGDVTLPAGTALVAANNLSDVSAAATALDNLVKNGVGSVTEDTAPSLPDDYVFTSDTSASSGVKKVKLQNIAVGAIIAIIEDQKAQNTAAQTLTSGSDQTRELTTLSYNRDSIASLSSNRFTLPAGTWEIAWSAPYFISGGDRTAQSFLYNQTDATEVARGQSVWFGASGTGDDGNVYSSGSAVVTIAGSKAFEIRHRVSSTNTGGEPSNFGTEVYTRVIVRRA
jgi:hypothetical protein